MHSALNSGVLATRRVTNEVNLRVADVVLPFALYHTSLHDHVPSHLPGFARSYAKLCSGRLDTTERTSLRRAPLLASPARSLLFASRLVGGTTTPGVSHVYRDLQEISSFHAPRSWKKPDHKSSSEHRIECEKYALQFPEYLRRIER